MLQGCSTVTLNLHFQAARAQQNLDGEAEQLAEDLSVMLAYAASCKDLVPVEGRENIILRAVRLTQEGACLMDALMDHRFAGRVSKSFLQSGSEVH